MSFDVIVWVQSKQKKIKDKYGDQDEEEREKRMEILAVRNVIEMFYFVFVYSPVVLLKKHQRAEKEKVKKEI